MNYICLVYNWITSKGFDLRSRLIPKYTNKTSPSSSNTSKIGISRASILLSNLPSPLASWWVSQRKDRSIGDSIVGTGLYGTSCLEWSTVAAVLEDGLNRRYSKLQASIRSRLLWQSTIVLVAAGNGDRIAIGFSFTSTTTVVHKSPTAAVNFNSTTKPSSNSKVNSSSPTTSKI